MNIVFFGTPEFAIPSCNAIHKSHTLQCIVSAPAKERGRGRVLSHTPIGEYAITNKIPLETPKSMHDKEFIKKLQNINAEIFIVVAFRKLPEEIWAMPPYGTINLHTSLLPNYRGAAPINRVLMNGEKHTGITTFFINDVIDSGNIIEQEKISLSENTTAGELHDKMMVKGSNLLLSTIKKVQNKTITTFVQEDEPTLQTAPKLSKEDCFLSRTFTIVKAHNYIRGLSPYPGAKMFFQKKNKKKMVKLLHSKLTSPPKEIIYETNTCLFSAQKLWIQFTDGFLEITDIQEENKKPMASKDFINGIKDEKFFNFF